MSTIFTFENRQSGPVGPSAYQVAVANGFVGSEAQWLASLRGDQGPIGNTGATGAQGAFGGNTTQYTFENSTVDANPSVGFARLNNANRALVTRAFVSKTANSGGDATDWLTAMASGTSTNKAIVLFGRRDAFASNYARYYLTGIEDATGYVKLDLTYIDHIGTLNTNGGNLLISIGQNGEKGEQGDKGDIGDTATIEIGTVTQIPPGDPPTVQNVGTPQAAVLNFGLPKGDKGDKGDTGEVSLAQLAAVLAPLRPVVLTQPTAASGNVGDSLSISCLGGILPNSHLNLTYQWQLSTDAGVSYNNITGATSPTIPFDPALFGQNGLYRCRLTNAFGSQDTNAVALTIDNSIRHLYGVNDRGVAWDLDRMDHLFSLFTGGVPITAYGDPVGLILTREQGGRDNLGANLVTNGDFSNGSTGWVVGPNVTNVSVVNGELEFTGSGSLGFSGSNWISQLNVFEVNDSARYEVRFDATWISGGNLEAGAGFTRGLIVTPNAAKTSYTFVTSRGQGGGENTRQTVAFAAASGAVWRIDNVSARKISGSHLIQATSSRRPTYARRPKSGIRNLYVNTGFIGALSGSPGTIPTGYGSVGNTGSQTVDLVSKTIRIECTSQRQFLQQQFNLVAATTYTFSFIGDLETPLSLWQIMTFSVPAGSSSATHKVNGVVTPIGNIIPAGVNILFEATATTGGAGVCTLRMGIGTSNNATGAITLKEPQFEIGSARTGYQLVGLTQFDITETGQPSINYLWCDGIDDCMVSASAIDWTTDEVTACLSQRKMTDASQRTLLEFGPSLDLNNQSWQLTAPNSAAANYAARSRGTGIANAIASGFAAPDLAMLTMQSKIGTDLLTLRRNKVEVASSTDDQGSGNYGNVVINLGAQNQASQFYQGHLNSGFVINRILNPLILADYERHWVAAKAGIDLP